jgi:hypothetical protein
VSAGTFAAFSKFHLNTSNSPNAKVVYFVEEHNFHVEWHLRFGVEMREKAWSTLVITVHRRPENSQDGMHFVHNWLRKRPYALGKSCRGSRDLQLRYRSLWVLQFEFLEKLLVKVGQSELFWHQRSRACAERRRCALPCSAAVGPLGPDAEAGYHPLVRTSWGRPRRTAFSALSPCSTHRAPSGHAAPTMPPAAQRRRCCIGRARRHTRAHATDVSHEPPCK